MKTKSLFLTAFLVCSSLSLNAQWNTSTSPITPINQYANVGLGTTNPLNALEIARPNAFVVGLNRVTTGATQKSELGFYKNGTIKWTVGTDLFDTGANNFHIWNGAQGAALYVNANNNVGIGTINPAVRLDVAGDVCINDKKIYLRGSDTKHGLGYKWTFGGSTIDGPALFGFAGGALGTVDYSGVEQVALSWYNAQVNIGAKKYKGTTHTDYRLSVDGKVIAPSFYALDPNANWADYVFDKEYKLTPLEDVEKFIAVHKHLPEVPSTQEVQENGINLQDMDALLLKKVEELTLHLIEMKKEMNNLKQENTQLKKTVGEFSK